MLSQHKFYPKAHLMLLDGIYAIQSNETEAETTKQNTTIIRFLDEEPFMVP